MEKNRSKSTDSSRISVGLRKREQIKQSSRTMFIWVAGASVVVSFSVVASIFLIKQFVFNSTVLLEKNKTATTLSENIESAKELNQSVNQLRANRSIASVPSIATKGNNLDKIFDALPYEEDAVGLGSSLQTTLLNGSAIESLNITSPETAANDAPTVDSLNTNEVSIEAPGGTEYISFSFKVSGDENEIKDTLQKLNRSIRPIKLVSFELQAAGNDNLELSAEAITYYQPKKEFEIKEKTLKP